MEYHRLGTSELQVSRISLGCMSLPEDNLLNQSILHHAFDGGINFFDTADLYQKGRNETFVGQAFHDRRDQVIIASKVGNQWRPDGSGWDWNPHKTYILSAVEDSLRRLQTDYIDLYQLHGGTIEDPIDETIEAFEILQQQGKIRYYGISSIRPNVIREWLKRSHMVSNMMQYSLLDRRPEEQALELLHQQQTGVIVRGGVAKGLLAGKAPSDYLDYRQKEVSAVQEVLQALSNDQRSAGQTGLRYCLAHQAVTTIAVGASSIHQVKENIETLQTPPLNQAEMTLLRQKTKENKYQNHR